MTREEGEEREREREKVNQSVAERWKDEAADDHRQQQDCWMDGNMRSDFKQSSVRHIRSQFFGDLHFWWRRESDYSEATEKWEESSLIMDGRNDDFHLRFHSETWLNDWLKRTQDRLPRNRNGIRSCSFVIPDTHQVMLKYSLTIAIKNKKKKKGTRRMRRRRRRRKWFRMMDPRDDPESRYQRMIL